MPLSAGLLLKSLGGLLSVAATAAGTWWLFTKDQVTWTALDDEAFKATGESWKWSLAVEKKDSTNPKTLTATATLTGTPDSTQKTWTCKITGTLSDNDVSTATTDGIKEQLKAEFKTKTGLPDAGDNTDTKVAWTKPTDISHARKFFENCIRNRTKDEQNNASTKSATSATSTIKLNLEKISGDTTKYKFNESQFKKLYEGVIYSVK